MSLPIPFICGLSIAIGADCVVALFALTADRILNSDPIPSRMVCTLFFDGFMSNLTPYLRTFHPGNSKPSPICVLLD